MIGFSFFAIALFSNIFFHAIHLLFLRDYSMNTINDLADKLILFGLLLIFLDVILLSKQRRKGMLDYVLSNKNRISVVLTAYNDEESIGGAVKDFRLNKNVERVIVVDNDSSDNTATLARAAGAIVVREERRGYGNCVYRALEEGSKYDDTDLVALCEGDLTFRAADLDKFLAYIDHGEIINGTRIVEQLRSPSTQLTNFMYFGNFFVAKILELKHLGRGTITDVGTTYKICKSDFLRDNLKYFNRNVNLEFNAHFLDVALGRGHRIVEIPVTFHPRVGESKGGNSSNLKAFGVGIRMIFGIFFGWHKPQSEN
jgi:glycosyltransferase involved in cell wall biosynthesis